MRLVCFQRHRYRALGALHEQRLVDLSAAAAAWLGVEQDDPFYEQEVALRLPADIREFLAGGAPSRSLAAAALAFACRTPTPTGIDGEPLLVEMSDIRLLLPLKAPLILAAGARFNAGQDAEANERVAHREFFMRNPLNVLGPSDMLHLPTGLGEDFDVAPRVAVVIGERLQRASHVQAQAAIHGFCAAMEVCARSLEKISWAGPMFHLQYPHARSFDGALILGAAIVSRADVGDPAHLVARLSIDGNLVYDAPVPGRWDDLVSWIVELSEVVTLEPGTLLIPGSAEATVVQPAEPPSRPAQLSTDRSIPQPRLSRGASVTLHVAGLDTITTRID